MTRFIGLAIGFVALASLSLAGLRLVAGSTDSAGGKWFAADNKNIQYTGRIDFTDPKKPRFWSPGVSIQAKFQGTSCEIALNDEELYGTSHNYFEVVIDGGKPVRLQTTGKTNIISVAQGLSDGAHTITLCKDTEAGIGYLEFLGFRCDALLPLPPKPKRKLEFIGDSITVGTGSDLAEHPCGQGQWYDQQNTYLSYGPTTARSLDAQWQITAVSGIGMAHSCCGMTLTMPDVFDKLDLHDNTGAWDFRRYQPDAVTICLGQNDGTQNPSVFRDTYVRFIGQVRKAYPKAQIVCLNSPMADSTLTAYLKDSLTRIVAQVNSNGDKNVHTFFFSRQFDGGCGGHPNLASHKLMADELSAYLATLLKWGSPRAVS